MSTRRALVTGGSRGIGRAAAHALAERGWRVALVARSKQALGRTLAELPGAGHASFSLDVSDEQAWERIGGDLSDVGAVVCAAGILPPVGPIGSYSVSDARRTIDINVVGTLLAIAACLPALRARGGAVVTFGGGGATSPLPRFDAYAASKAAVVRLTENLARELERDGVRVNCVAPGFVATDIHEATLAAGPGLAGSDYLERTRAELARGGVPVTLAAELVCLLVEAEPDAPFTGKLVSAQWDPWREPGFRERLAAEPDLATLRRIDDVQFARVAERARA